MWKLKRKINIDACNLDSDFFCSFFNNFIQFAKKKKSLHMAIFFKIINRLIRVHNSRTASSQDLVEKAGDARRQAWAPGLIALYLASTAPEIPFPAKSQDGKKENSKSYIYIYIFPLLNPIMAISAEHHCQSH